MTFGWVEIFLEKKLVMNEKIYSNDSANNIKEMAIFAKLKVYLIIIVSDIEISI